MVTVFISCDTDSCEFVLSVCHSVFHSLCVCVCASLKKKLDVLESRMNEQ